MASPEPSLPPARTHRRRLLWAAGGATSILLAGCAGSQAGGAQGGGGSTTLANGSGQRQQVAGARSLPPSAQLPVPPDIERYQQAYPLSCEQAALHTALALLGLLVTEEQMRPHLPRNDDPDLGFRGDIDANQTLDDYGIHAKGLLKLIEALRANGLVPTGTQGQIVHSLDEMRAAVAQRHPVIVWIPLQLMDGARVPITLSNGKVVNLVEHEHTVTLRGYDSGHVMVLDPFDGSGRTYDAGAFEAKFKLFDDPGLAISAPGK